MPERNAIERAQHDAEQGKSPLPRQADSCGGDSSSVLRFVCCVRDAVARQENAHRVAISPTGVTAHGGPSGPLQFDRLGSRPGHPMRWLFMEKKTVSADKITSSGTLREEIYTLLI